MIVTQISDYRYPSTMVLEAHCKAHRNGGSGAESFPPQLWGEMHCHFLHCHFELALEFHDSHRIENGFRTVSEARLSRCSGPPHCPHRGRLPVHKRDCPAQDKLATLASHSTMLQMR